MGAFDPDLSWESAAGLVLPLLKRVRQSHAALAEPVEIRVPPGIWTGFGFDLGTAFAHVSHRLLERWGVEPATLLATSLDNLVRRAAEEPIEVVRHWVEETPIDIAQALGWGSSLVLAPELLRTCIGDEPRLVMTPIRNALVAFPPDVDIELAGAVWDALASGEPDALAADPVRWTGSAIVAMTGGGRGLAN